MKTSWAVFRVASHRRLRGLLLALVALGGTGIAIAAYGTGLLSSLEGNTVDARFSIRGTQHRASNIVIVKIDDKTFQDLNLQWPFPRRVEGRLLDRLVAGHPRAVAFDVQFTESSTLGQNDDLALIKAVMRSHGKTVFSTTETDAHGHTRFLGSSLGTKLLGEIGSRAGNGLFPFDSGGVIRSMSYELGHVGTLALVTDHMATGRRVARSHFNASGQALIDYAGPSGTFPSFSYSDVLRGQVPTSRFDNKIVVVGATAPSLQDIHPTSTDSQMSGPEIQANAIATALRGFPLAYLPAWANVLLIVLLGTAVPLISLRLGPVAATGCAVALGLLFAVLAQSVFDSGAVVAFVYPLGGLILSGAGSLSVQLLTEAFERIRVRDMFSRFVPENVVDEVLRSADGLRLGGVQRDGTVMFTDLRGFTSLAESLSPARVIEVLNRYLSEMSDTILDHGGTLVSYMGDGIMAVFGAPLPQEDHADRALATAREMLRVRLPQFNTWLRAEGLGDGVRMGIGLNSGHVLSGHVGSERRVEYTAVGDTTNTASRIEAMTKGTPHQLLLSSATKGSLTAPSDDLIYFDEVAIRGRVETIELWSLKEVHESFLPDALQASDPAV